MEPIIPNILTEYELAKMAGLRDRFSRPLDSINNPNELSREIFDRLRTVQNMKINREIPRENLPPTGPPLTERQILGVLLNNNVR